MLIRTRLRRVLLAGCLVIPGACSSDPAADAPVEEQNLETVPADLQVKKLTVVDPRDRPEAAEVGEKAGEAAVEVMNEFYDIAFLDPDRWDGGRHGDLLPLMTAKGQTRIPKDLESLALGKAAPLLLHVEPARQEITEISVLVEDDLTAAVALVTVRFEATGIAADGIDEVPIVHHADYWLARQDGEYLISAFSADLRIGDPRKVPK